MLTVFILATAGLLQGGLPQRVVKAAWSDTGQLDAAGNRVSHSKVSGAWEYDANNRLIKVGEGPCGNANTLCFEYDAAGNRTQKIAGDQTTRYRHDTRNRLIEVAHVLGGTEALIARYGYDPTDRRLWKEQYRDKTGQPLPQAKRSYYLYSEEGLIAEATQAITLHADNSVTATGQPDITTQYGPRPDAAFTTGVLFAKTKNSNGQDTFAYYHHDHLETPLQATDKEGHIVWSASYNVFGRATITTPAATADKPTITSQLRLPGQYEDEETGLHYNFRRYYEPETGRYITSDPIGVEGGINLYQYAGSDPVNLADPTGEVAPAVKLVFDVGSLYGRCYASCMLSGAVFNKLTGACEEPPWADCAKECLNPFNWGGRKAGKRGVRAPKGGVNATSMSDILLPNGRPIGYVSKGAGPRIRTVTSNQFGQLQSQLMDGATPVATPSRYTGTWYQRADGTVFGIRTSTGSGTTIDVIKSNNPSLPPGLKVHQQ